jgi:hypothetical protein
MGIDRRYASSPAQMLNSWTARATVWALFACAACSGSAGGPGFGASSGAPFAGSGSDSAHSGESATGGDAGVVWGTPDGNDAGPLYSDAAVGSMYDVAAPDAAGQTYLTLTMDPFVVNPGDEVYKCQQFGNPFGKNVDFVYYEGKMSQGSHHFFLFNMEPITGRTQAAPFGDCPERGIEFHPFPYLAQQPNWNVGYPQPGMGYPFVSSNGLMMNVHYLNSGSTPITAQVSIRITVAAPGTVTTHVGSLFLNNTLFSVPASVPMSSPVSETKTTIPLLTDYTIFTSWSHMHRTALKFTASANGNVFYTETNWDSPQVIPHTPFLPMKGGTSITWNCDYYNPSSQALSFGDSATNNVMCIYIGQYFPADPTNPDILSVLN